MTDSGSGMDAATLARALEPFFTTKGSGRGTGLGLPMAKGFAEQSGGGLRIESAAGQGTTVRLWFPVASDVRCVGQATGRVEARTCGQRATVLLVDDEPLVREMVAAELEAAGYVVVAAESGLAALAHMDAGMRVDVVVSDLSMPGMDGIALIREAQGRRPGLPAILLTGFATEAAGLALGGTFTLLRKPIEGTALAERVAVLIEGAARSATSHSRGFARAG